MATDDLVAFNRVTSIVERKTSKVSLIGLKSYLHDTKVRFQAWLRERKEWRKRVSGFSADGGRFDVGGGCVDTDDPQRRSLLEVDFPFGPVQKSGEARGRGHSIY